MNAAASGGGAACGTALRALVTTARKACPKVEEQARDLARRYGLTFVNRDGLSVQALQAKRTFEAAPPPVIVVGDDGLCLYANGIEFRYHPGMGVNRIRNLRRGGEDWMVKAMGLRPGDHVLDATLGIGSDLLVASYVSGERGRLVGLESEALLALVVREGMKGYVHDVPEVNEALRRIEVVHADYERYLAGDALAGSFDVVYFDPLFEDPVLESRHMIPLRALGNSAPLSRRALELAKRAARRCVVVKDRKEGPYADSGWFDRVVGGPKSRICYCVLDA